MRTLVSYRRIFWVLLILTAACRPPPETPPAEDVAVKEPPAGTNREGDFMDLSPGSPVERSLKPGETHAYRLELSAGDFLEVGVDQRGIDVAVRLFDPAGEQLLEVDRPIGYTGAESLLAVAEASGAYRMEVSGADWCRVPGLYEVTAGRRRRATERDRKMARAASRLSRGDQLRWGNKLHEAKEEYLSALELWEELEEPAWQGETLDRIGMAFQGLRELRQAAERHEQAARLFQAAGKPRWQAIALSNLGTMLLQLGEVGDAVRRYGKARLLAQEAGNLGEEAILFHNLGRAYSLRGEVQLALDNYAEALRRCDQERDFDLKTRTLHNVGILYGWLGERRRALDYLQEAEKGWVELGQSGYRAATLNQLGKLHRELGELETALGYHQQALALRRESGHRRGEAAALSEIGRVDQLLKRPEAALKHYEQALEILADRQYPRSLAKVLLYRGGLERELGQGAQGVTSYREALRLYQEIGDPTGEAESLVGLARAERGRGDLREAGADMERALQLLERIRSSSVRQGLRTSFFASQEPHFEFYVDLLMELHRDDPAAGIDALALTASERARARSLLDLLAESGAGVRRGAEASLLERERSIERRISEHVLLLEGSYDAAGALASSQIRNAQSKLRSLMDELEAVKAEIRVESPRYAALTQPRPLNLEEIQRQVLDDATVLLEYRLGEERSFLWVVTTQTLASFELPGRDEIEPLARTAHKLLTRSHLPETRASVPNTLCELAEKVLQPAAGYLDKPRLAVVPDGALEYVPFAALPLPGTEACRSAAPLVTEHEVVTLPSAAALSLLRRQIDGRRPAPGQIAVVADPVFAEDEERLPYLAAEADAIVSLATGPSFKALGGEASKETVMSGKLAGYRIVHFATHATLDAVQPGLSGLALSDGDLRAHEIYSLELPADLVVLSACQTALGEEIRGEGLVGLTRGFFYAGAARVVVSLWQVGDRNTAELMRRFYHGLFTEGLRPAAALRQAQVSMWRDEAWSAPYHWAGFILEGEWR